VNYQSLASDISVNARTIKEWLSILEAFKAQYNQGQIPNLYFYRDSHGNEIDLLYASGRDLIGIEVKSAATFTSHFKKMPLRFSENQQALKSSFVVYNGVDRLFSDGTKVINFRDTSSIF